MSESGPSGQASDVLHPGDAEEKHEHSAVPYVVVWIALLLFTAAHVLHRQAPSRTVGAPHRAGHRLHQERAGGADLHAPLESSGMPRLIFVTSLVFVGLLMFFTVADVATRFRPATPAGAPFGTERSQPEGLLEHELPE